MEKNNEKTIFVSVLAGMIDVGFFHDGLPLVGEENEADWSKSLLVAERFYKKWDYARAEPSQRDYDWRGFQHL